MNFTVSAVLAGALIAASSTLGFSDNKIGEISCNRDAKKTIAASD